MGEGSGVVTVSPGLAREGKEVQAGPGSTWGVCNAEPGPGGWGGGCPPTAPPLRGTDLAQPFHTPTSEERTRWSFKN